MRKFWTFYIFIVTLLAQVAHQGSQAVSEKIHPDLITAFSTGEPVNVLISFAGSNKEITRTFHGQSFPSRGEKISLLKQALMKHAAKTQKNVQAQLKLNSMEFKSFWISNQIYIKSATREVVESLAFLPEVEDVRLEGRVKFDSPLITKSSLKRETEPEVLWNIKKIKADQAWYITNGTGSVVGVIDTGALATHEAIRDSFRGVEYGWFDAVKRESIPYDELGHGTHVTGSIAGNKGIGVAPGATWISCQTCPRPEGNGDCLQSSFIACTEWMLCPTRPDGTSPDCSKAPNVVSNSWGYEPGATTFEPIISAWVAADIVPVFSAGNGHYTCEVILSPGDLEEAISVGSTNVNDYISQLSSFGPASNHDKIKPEITAPGESIVSGSFRGDDLYQEMSGTSMAAPHISGVVALLLSIRPNMTVAEVRKTLFESGVDTDLRFIESTCGGKPGNILPNYVFGHGRVNALKVVSAVK